MMSWKPTTLATLLQQRVAERGDTAALVTESNRTGWTELHAKVRRVAKALLAIGIGRGDFVGLLASNDESWVITFYGAAMIGAVTVPVNTRFKADEIRYTLGQSGVKLLVQVDRFLKIDFSAYLREAEPAVDTQLPGQLLPKLVKAVVIGEDVPHAAIGWSAFLAAGDSVSDEVLDSVAKEVMPTDLLLIQYTSGTTANPKGVMLTHDNMLRNASAASQRIGLCAEDIYFNCRPFFHVAGSTLSLLATLVQGACLVTLPTFEAGAALALMAREKCTFISGNDTLFQLLMAHPDFDRTKLSLKGGWSASGAETMKRIVDEMGIGSICWAYGLSEASPNVVMSDFRDPLLLRVQGLALPLEGVKLRIVDDSSGRVCDPLEVGEIQVQGWGVMKGYLEMPEQNAKVFSADGWLRTGDLGSLRADGRLVLIGRLKDVFRVGGENVAPAEIESVILCHPSIALAQVIGVPDARLGEVPAAFVTVKAGAQLDESILREWLRSRVANFRLPRYFAIVSDFEAIGMTASGKVQKVKLRAHAIERFQLQGLR